MSGSKPVASLTAGLLARKGDARPAIRPAYIAKTSVTILPVSAQNNFGERGPNTDMGANDAGIRHSGEVAHFPTPAPHPVRQQLDNVARAMRDTAPLPEVQPDMPPEAAPAAEPVRKTARKRSAVAETPVSAPPVCGPSAKARKAFTLRLDPERHQRLHLAKARSQQSAQDIVTCALDAYLDSQTDI